MDMAQDRLYSGYWSQRDFDRYYRIWVFSSIRYTGGYHAAQSLYCRKHGAAGLYAIIKTIRSILGLDTKTMADFPCVKISEMI